MIGHMDQVKDPRGLTYVEKVFLEISAEMGFSGVEEAITNLRKMMKEMELAAPKSESRESDLDILAQSVNPIRLKNNPVGLTLSVSRELYSFIVS
jgi:hypothetical protein